MNDTAFLFDDFFASDNDPGVVIGVTIKGRRVPITIKRGLSVTERTAAEQKAVRKHTDPSGRLVFDGVDEAVLVEELLVAAIKDWPFKNSDGSAVPVTRENIRRMLGGAEEIASAIQTIDREGESALAPFEQPSAAA